MKLLISPAKKMRAEDFLPPRTQPPLLEKSAQLLDYVRGLSLPQLKRLLACNESLAQEAFKNFRAMELGRGTTPALLAYDGVELVFEQTALEAVADKAIERNIGARGLRAVLEATMTELMYEVPSDPTISKVIITADSVLQKGNPIVEHDNARLDAPNQEAGGAADQEPKEVGSGHAS